MSLEFLLKSRKTYVTAESKLSDSYGHVILPRKRYFRGRYLRVVRSRNISTNQLEILSNVKYLSLDVIYDTYVDTNNNLQLDINI